jgi:anaerobic selenocysteine-containing dehydrogenase
MERRDFLKISAATGTTAALSSCGHPADQLIRFIPEDDLQPGVAVFKPSVCTMCPAGCGLTVRVMEGDAEVVRHGKLGLVKMGLAKKLEGNADHPVNHGKLCARGQAGLQVTYHPDRVRTPLRRTGPRGSGKFEEIGWDEAIKSLISQLVALRASNQAASLAFLTRPLRGLRADLVARFLAAFGAPPAVTFETFDETVLRYANVLNFGRPQLPTFDLAHANYLVSFGADFLGTWNSPVAQAIGYGEFRQGRPGRRGKLVMVEPRLSQTGANADEWIPARPGNEGLLALAIGHVIAVEKLVPMDGNGLAQWFGRPDLAPERVEKPTGVRAATINRIAREMAAQQPAVAMIGGAPLAQTNGLFSAEAVNALNVLLGNTGKSGGVGFAPQLSPPLTPKASYSDLSELVRRALTGRTGVSGVSSRPISPSDNPAASPHGPANVLLIYEANPVFGQPGFTAEVLTPIPFIASFGSFIDETSIQADLILPDHSPLESWLDVVPESGSLGAVASLAPPAVRPLHDTRSMPDILLAVASQLGGGVARGLPWKTLQEALPWKTYQEALKVTFAGVGSPGFRVHLPGPKGAGEPEAERAGTEAEDSWRKLQEQGGWWSADSQGPSHVTAVDVRAASFSPVEPRFDGDAVSFPFHFLPYASQAFVDGSTAHLPWMQELPDVLSTAMWSVWVEINPQAAGRLSIQQGDLVEVASQHGKLRAPAILYPGIAPDVVAMPVGQGHEHFTRYASARGANPISILAPMAEESVGALAWAATRVNIRRVGDGKKQLTLFGGGMREELHEKR